MKRIIFTVIYLGIGSNACVNEDMYCSQRIGCEGDFVSTSEIIVCNDPSACNFYDVNDGACNYTYSEEACLYDNECDEYTTTG